MTQKLLDHEWHNDTSWEQLPAWIGKNARLLAKLRHGEELVGRNVRYRVVGRTLMRRLRWSVSVVAPSQERIGTLDNSNQQYRIGVEQITTCTGDGDRHDDAFDGLEMAVRIAAERKFVRRTKQNR